jgi:hypothetical protein
MPLRDVGSPPHPLGFEPDHKPHSVAMDRVADRPQTARRAVGGFRPLDGKASYSLSDVCFWLCRIWATSRCVCRVREVSPPAVPESSVAEGYPQNKEKNSVRMPDGPPQALRTDHGQTGRNP